MHGGCRERRASIPKVAIEFFFASQQDTELLGSCVTVRTFWILLLLARGWPV